MPSQIHDVEDTDICGEGIIRTFRQVFLAIIVVDTGEIQVTCQYRESEGYLQFLAASRLADSHEGHVRMSLRQLR